MGKGPLAALAIVTLAACGSLALGGANPAPAISYGNPRQISIIGYDGDAMEPYLSRDGTTLFFNNSNAPDAQTDLHWASRRDDLTFLYGGKVDGGNSPALDGVPSMTAGGRLCFISTRSYFDSLGSVYCGAWRNGAVTGLAIQERLSPHKLGRLVFDVELSASGDQAIISDGTFSGGALPDAADLRIGRWDAGSYRLAPEEDWRLAAVNTGDLEYAAALSPDGAMLAFTRASRIGPLLKTRVWLSKKDSNGRFGTPQQLAGIKGDMVEAPSFSPDARAIYYHAKVDGRYRVWRVSQ